MLPLCVEMASVCSSVRCSLTHLRQHLDRSHSMNVLHFTSCPPSQNVMSQHRYKNIGGDSAKSLARAEVGGICCSLLVLTIMSQKVVRWVRHDLRLVNPHQLLPVTVLALLRADVGSRRSHSLILPGTDRRLAGLWFLRLAEGRCDIGLSPVVGDLPDLHDL